MSMLNTKYSEDLNSTHDYNELNDEITKLVSLMTQCKEEQCECNDEPTSQSNIKSTIQDNDVLYFSPIWKNTLSPQLSNKNSFSTNQSSFNASFNSSMTSPIPSPNRLFVCAQSPIEPIRNYNYNCNCNCNYNGNNWESNPMTTTPFYSMTGPSSKYDKAFNSNMEIVHVPHLDSEKNIIHLEDIFTRKEQRTTLMIRHIPNKYTLKQFTEEINRKFINKYDVLYLPIDYTNNCNLGFAFINFVDPMHIIDFYETFRGKKWSKYLSEKRCELAFAKIQGKLNLMSHFEKGSVLHCQTEDKKPLILATPNPLPSVTLPLKFETALRQCYPHSKYSIDSMQGCIVVKSFI